MLGLPPTASSRGYDSPPAVALREAAAKRRAHRFTRIRVMLQLNAEVLSMELTRELGTRVIPASFGEKKKAGEPPAMKTQHGEATTATVPVPPPKDALLLLGVSALQALELAGALASTVLLARSPSSFPKFSLLFLKRQLMPSENRESSSRQLPNEVERLRVGQTGLPGLPGGGRNIHHPQTPWASSRTRGGLSTRPDAFRHTPTRLTRLLRKRFAGKAPERGVGARSTAIGAGLRERGGAPGARRGERPHPAACAALRGSGGRAGAGRAAAGEVPAAAASPPSSPPPRLPPSVPPSLPGSGAALPAAARQRRRFLPGPPSPPPPPAAPRHGVSAAMGLARRRRLPPGAAPLPRARTPRRRRRRRAPAAPSPPPPPPPAAARRPARP